MARRIKADRRRGVKPPLDRIALVVARPLPYLYLAREVFSGAGIPYEALDTLPLAAEPYAAAVDVVLEAVSANFTRRSMMALLRSPHFRFQADGADVDRASMAALDIAMAEQRYLGGLDRLRALVDTWTGAERPAARAALGIATMLAPLAGARPMIDQVSLLQSFLEAHDREHDDRRRRARRAVGTGTRGAHRCIWAPRSVSDGHGHRAISGDPPLDWLADVRDRDDSRRRADPRRAIGAVRRRGGRADPGARRRRVARASAPQRVLSAIAPGRARTVPARARRHRRGARSRSRRRARRFAT